MIKWQKGEVEIIGESCVEIFILYHRTLCLTDTTIQQNSYPADKLYHPDGGTRLQDEGMRLRDEETRLRDGGTRHL